MRGRCRVSLEGTDRARDIAVKASFTLYPMRLRISLDRRACITLVSRIAYIRMSSGPGVNIVTSERNEQRGQSA